MEGSQRTRGGGPHGTPSESASRKRTAASLLLPLIGLGIFVWILVGTGVDNIVDTFRHVRPARLLVFPVLVGVVLWIKGMRWYALIRAVGLDYSMRQSVRLWAIGFCAGAVTPGKVGDAVRAFYLSRDTGSSLGVSLLTVFMDRLMDLVIVLVFGLVTIVVFSHAYTDVPSAWIIVALVAGTLAVIYLALRRDLVRTLLGPLFRALTPEKYKGEMSAQFHSFYDSLGLYARRWKQTLFGIGCTLLSWSGVVVIAYCVTWVLDIDVSFGYVVLIMPIVTVVELLPISISGLGTREAVSIYFFAVIDVSAPEAVGFSVMYLVAGTYLTSLLGFGAWLSRPSVMRARLDT